MKKSFLIAHSNTRKAKGQTAAIIILILIASCMLNLWLMLSTDYKANFDRYHDRLNAEHVTVTLDGNSDELHSFLSETYENDDRVSQYRLDNCMHMTGSFEFNGGTIDRLMVFMDKETALTRSIGKSEIVEDSNYKSGVYLPMICKTDDIDIGKPIEISIGSNKVTYTVCGFFNNIMMGANNCSFMEIILTEDKYSELQTLGYVIPSTLCSVRLNDLSENTNYEADIKSTISEHYPNINMMTNNYDTVAQARYVSQMICSGIISAMAFFVLLIAIVVIASNIINYIQVNMKNLGALKAVGYTSGQIMNSLLFQFLTTATIAAIVGVMFSYCLFPPINTMMISQTGIPYEVQFLPLPLIFSLAIPCGTVALAVWLASRRIKKIEPITALRSGVQTHSFKRNHVLLERTKSPLNLALALKTTFSEVKQNITVAVTMLVLSLVVVFSGIMIENMIIDTTPFIDLVQGETADSYISVKGDAENDFLDKMNSDSRVEKIYLYTSILNVSHTGGAGLVCTICDDFSRLSNQSIVYEGRFPKYDNEIAIAGKYANENGFKIGDEIEITANGNREVYLITGYIQLSNNLGKECFLTRSGYEKLGTFSDSTYYLILKDRTDIDAFNTDVEKTFGNAINTAINFQDAIIAVASVYVSLMTIIVIAILILSIIIISFVLYLLIRTMLNNKARDYGTMKALGFTTRQLILQTALSFMPVIIISTAIGLILCSLIINPLLAFFFSSLGIVKCTFAVPIGFIIIAGTVLILLTFLIICLLYLKIKKIAPKELLTGE